MNCDKILFSENIHDTVHDIVADTTTVADTTLNHYTVCLESDLGC